VTLLTEGNPKTAKGEAAGYLTAVLHLAPAETAGCGNICPASTAGCRAACLNTAGRGGILAKGATTNTIQEARKRRTVFYKQTRLAFEELLAVAVERHVARARRLKLTPCFRLNGTSDLPGLAYAIAERFPGVQFYDYTKIPRPWLRERSNYHLTFSRSESNEAEAREALAHGISVAVVFAVRKGKPLPAADLGRPVFDGDVNDLRFLDPRGIIIGVRAKGKAKRDVTGFVVT
jgi:hypothetical protein